MASPEKQTSRPVAERSGGVQNVLETERRAWEDAVKDAILPPGTVVTPAELAGVPYEWVEQAGTRDCGVILFLHGGGYNAGSCLTHRELAARLALSSGLSVLTVDYRLAPEFPFPAALEDAVAVYEGVLELGHGAEQVVLGGDSAGGGLVASALVRLRDDGKPLPAAAFMLSPMLDLTFSGPSVRSLAHLDLVVTLGALQAAADYYLAGRSPDHPLASPLFANLTGLPPLLLQVGNREILLDDSVRFVEKARAAGVDVRLEVWEDRGHVWQASSGLPEAERALAHIAEFIGERTRAGASKII